MILSLFIVMVSLLLIHEMDAVRTKEWKMFIILKDMEDEQAYRLFVIAHLPLYFSVLFIMIQGGAQANEILFYLIDLFIVGHSFIHYAFRKKVNNGFTSFFSKALIYGLGFLAVTHLFLLLLINTAAV